MEALISMPWSPNEEAFEGKNKPVPKELIDEIIPVAKGPSSMNTQPWFFHVVTGEPLKKFAKGILKGCWPGLTSIEKSG